MARLRESHNLYLFTRNRPTVAIDPSGQFVIVVFAVWQKEKCKSHMGDIKNQADNAVDMVMRDLVSDYDPVTQGIDAEGSVGDAFQHCIGACMAYQDPGPCCSRAVVRWGIDRRENRPNNIDDIGDLANNQVGYGITGSCVEGCRQALRERRLTCANARLTTTIPCILEEDEDDEED